MNKQIELLYRQAHIAEERYPAGCDGHPDISSVFDAEKFAKLIIVECMNVFEAEIDSWNQMEPFKGSMKRRGSHAMASHFGIEE